MSAYLFIALQRILPKHIVTALVFRIARIRRIAIKNFLIRNFIRAYDVNIDEVDASVPDGYENFNAFFTRELAAGSRPVDTGSHVIASPVDGTVSAAGTIEDDMLFQAKRHRYSLKDLLATDLQDVDAYRNGHFATIYLAPCNYHRVHAPADGRLRVARYVPGDLFSVNATTVSGVPRLFSRNERLICHFESADGPFMVIFVGALNVGSINTPWTGDIRPRKHGVTTDCDLSGSTISTAVAKGDLLGWFNMGSTVIVLFPGDVCEWVPDLIAPKTLRMGEAIGRRKSESDG